MKSNVFLSLFAAASLLFAGCSASDEVAVKVPEGMNVISLSEYGKPFTLFVPDTSSSLLSIEETSNGALIVSSGRNFVMAIHEHAADLPLKKQDIEADEVNRLKRIIQGNDSLLMWESAITEPQYHFMLNRKIGGGEYTFSEAAGFTFSESDIRTMCESALSAHEQ